MKIESSNIIKVAGRSTGADSIKDLKKGSELTARTIERLGERDALLEIGGKRVRAEFVKGLPSAGSLLLKLEDIKNSLYIFKIVDPYGFDESIKRILDFTIFDPKDFAKNVLHAASGFFSKQPSGIFELSAALLSLIAKSEKREDRMALLLNRLLALGMSHDRVSELSILLSGADLGSKTIWALLSLLGFGDGLDRWSSRRGKKPDELVNDIVSDIDGIGDESRKEEIVRDLVRILAEGGRGHPEYQQGELAFFHEGLFYPVRYIGKKNTWVFSIEFSYIGRIDILARDLEAGYYLSIFCEQSDVIRLLFEAQDQLLDAIKSINSNIHINFYNMHSSVNKIVEIYSRYSLNSVFDAKA